MKLEAGRGIEKPGPGWMWSLRKEGNIDGEVLIACVKQRGAKGWRYGSAFPEQAGSRTPCELGSQTWLPASGRSGLLFWGIQQKDKKILRRIFKI